MWRLIFPVLASLLFAAHLMFWNQHLWMAVPVALIALLFVKRAWVPRVIEVCFAVFTIEWVMTAYALYLKRIAAGSPWMLGVSIVAGCAVFTLLSALVFETRTLKKHYRRL